MSKACCAFRAEDTTCAILASPGHTRQASNAGLRRNGAHAVKMPSDGHAPPSRLGGGIGGAGGLDSHSSHA
eukprot:5552101-Pyramimonas_sp.AAC.1